jgi:hypothetical protein
MGYYLPYLVQISYFIASLSSSPKNEEDTLHVALRPSLPLFCSMVLLKGLRKNNCLKCLFRQLAITKKKQNLKQHKNYNLKNISNSKRRD